MHGLMGGGWKRGATTVDAKDPGGETLGVSAKTYRRATPPRQSSTLHGAFRPSELRYTLHRIDDYLMRWLLQKYKRFHGSQRRAWAALHKAALDRPTLFAHWRIVHP